jgi:hypothetical protein
MDRKGRLRLEGELELRSQQFLLIALFPGATKLLRPSAFASLRGLVVIVALKTAFIYAFRPWLGRRIQRLEQQRAATVDRLSRELGRKPTDDEVHRTLFIERHQAA